MTQNTLPYWLKTQASERANSIAIRHKKLGVWQEKSWRAIDQEIVQLSELLRSRGFVKGDTLFLLSYPRPEALFIAIAAQLLGGVTAPLDPSVSTVEMKILLQQLQPAFIFAEAQAQVEQVLTHTDEPTLIVYADKRGLAQFQHPALRYYSEKLLGGTDAIVRDSVDSTTSTIGNDAANKNENRSKNVNDTINAFIFYRLTDQERIEQQTLSHSDMLHHGQQLIDQEKLTHQEQALAARAFAASGHMRYLLAPWLLAGFTLNFPENIDTRDLDRRELGPTLVVGTRETYQRLHELVKTRFPLTGSWRKALVDWSLATTTGSSSLRKFFARFLILSPLRDVIGFTHTRTPLLVGDALPATTANFFSALGINIRQWPSVNEWKDIPKTPVQTRKKHQPKTNSNTSVGLAV